MATIAIAGGSGNLGRTIQDALQQSGIFNIVVLARKAATSTGRNTIIVAADYNDVEGLKRILETYSISTVISTISVMSPETGAAEQNLVKAAAAAAPTKRFIASNWGFPTPPESLRLPQHQFRMDTVELLRSTGLEWTEFYNGYLMDYYGIPHIQTHMPPIIFAVDIANKAAAIPGTGNEPLSFTYSQDLAKFVVAALSLPKWEEGLSCYSEKTTWNTVLSIAEEMTGSRFNVTYDNVEKLQSGEVTELPSHHLTYPFIPKPFLQAFFAKCGLYVINGNFVIKKENSLNEIFPTIKTMTVKEMLSVWAKQ